MDGTIIREAARFRNADRGAGPDLRMTMMMKEQTMDNGFSMERRLRDTAPDLHKRFTDAVFALQYNLSRYKLIFPEYTDHTNLHSLSVIDFCNQLAGSQTARMSADELYILLVSCYFHDTGMGITLKDYEDFSRRIDFGNYFETHSREDLPAIIRDFHHEYSGQFIRKYAPLFEIPSEEHLRAIIQVSRGHRRTNLMDEAEYPPAFEVPGGGTVCLPYLAALIRLADEIDVTAARNPVMLYDIEALTDEVQIVENKKVKAVREMEVSEEAFILFADLSDPDIAEKLHRMAAKMQYTLDECRRAVIGRTPYVITQERVELKKI